MFTQPCFIRRNTPELRKKLEELGYQSCTTALRSCDAICTFERDNKAKYMAFEIDEDFEVNIKDSFPFMDAGINEQLFLALAALRDDSDKNQWFVDGKTGYVFFCPFDSIIESSNQFLCYIHLPSIHKLTVKEIIEYFHEPSTEQRLENLANKRDC